MEAIADYHYLLDSKYKIILTEIREFLVSTYRPSYREKVCDLSFIRVN